MTRLVFISDTHGRLDQIDIPEGDLLVHSGDGTMMGSVSEVATFNHHLGQIKDRYTHGIVFTPGNHDWLYQDNRKLATEMTDNAKLVVHGKAEIPGLRLWLSAYQPEFGDWAFNLPRGWELQEKWADIPDGTDVIVTHGPVYGILDKVARYHAGEDPHVGCAELLKVVKRIKPKVHACGHIHEAYGRHEEDDTIFVNASIMNLKYKPVNKPIVVDL